jgi:hypothetical protein
MNESANPACLPTVDDNSRSNPSLRSLLEAEPAGAFPDAPASVSSLLILARQKKSWVVSGSGSLPSE